MERILKRRRICNTFLTQVRLMYRYFSDICYGVASVTEYKLRLYSGKKSITIHRFLQSHLDHIFDFRKIQVRRISLFDN